MRIRARHYRSGELVDFWCREGRIASYGPANTDDAGDAPWVAPALFDLQVNGCHGHCFNSGNLSAREVRQVVQVCHAHGLGGLCPTLVTGAFEALNHGFAT